MASQQWIAGAVKRLPPGVLRQFEQVQEMLPQKGKFTPVYEPAPRGGPPRRASNNSTLAAREDPRGASNGPRPGSNGSDGSSSSSSSNSQGGFASVNAGDVCFYVQGSGGINAAFDEALSSVRGVNTLHYVAFHNCFVECKVRAPGEIFEIHVDDPLPENKELVAMMRELGLIYSCVTVPERSYRGIFESYSPSDSSVKWAAANPPYRAAEKWCSNAICADGWYRNRSTAGLVFLDVLAPGKRPLNSDHNVAMLYCVGPVGQKGNFYPANAQGSARFLEDQELVGRNIMRVVHHYNARVFAQQQEQQGGSRSSMDSPSQGASQGARATSDSERIGAMSISSDGSSPHSGGESGGSRDGRKNKNKRSVPERDGPPASSESAGTENGTEHPGSAAETEHPESAANRSASSNGKAKRAKHSSASDSRADACKLHAGAHPIKTVRMCFVSGLRYRHRLTPEEHSAAALLLGMMGGFDPDCRGLGRVEFAYDKDIFRKAQHFLKSSYPQLTASAPALTRPVSAVTKGDNTSAGGLVLKKGPRAGGPREDEGDPSSGRLSNGAGAAREQAGGGAGNSSTLVLKPGPRASANQEEIRIGPASPQASAEGSPERQSAERSQEEEFPSLAASASGGGKRKKKWRAAKE